MGTHTPGPWQVVTDAENNYPAEVHGLTKRGLSKAVARVARHPNGDVLANAAMLAAAPDLLHALYEVDNASDYMDFDPESRFGLAMAKVHAAIAKATQP